MAAIVVTTSPAATGIKFFLASSNGSTLQIAAAGISAHAPMFRLRPRSLKSGYSAVKTAGSV